MGAGAGDVADALRQAEEAAGTRALPSAAAAGDVRATPAEMASGPFCCCRQRPDRHFGLCLRPRRADIDRLDRRGARGRRRRLHPETTSLDPMRADALGFSLATAAGPRRLCAARPTRPARAICSAAGWRRTRSRSARRFALLKPLLEDRPSSRSAQNVKYDLVVMTRHGIDLSPFDDTMLMSYVLDAGINSSHGMDALAERWLGHKPIHYQGGRRLAASDLTLRPCRDRQGHRLCGRGCRHDVAAVAGA